MHFIILMILVICCIDHDDGKNLDQLYSHLKGIFTRSMSNRFMTKDFTVFRSKRSLPIEYPNGPLENNVPSTFTVMKLKKKKCGLFENIPDEVTTYKVMMIEKEFGEIYTNFYVVPGSSDFLRSTDPEVEEYHIQRRYDNQIAYGHSVC